MIDLVGKEILNQIGTTGKGTYYILRRQRGHKGDISEGYASKVILSAKLAEWQTFEDYPTWRHARKLTC